MAFPRIQRARVFRLAALFACGLLTACQQPPQAARVELAPNETLRITRSVWEQFEYYKALLVLQGAFVVSETGSGAGYRYCPGTDCRPEDYARRAIDLCERAGVKCVVFAVGTEILVDYEIVD